ncbi:hypothetical protein MLD38_018652 [Melastoma candidum]|uniref:Uncharacterized protein n=1 Tax=Melastoma candidum TaxID=119954 RepID=A0ACB9QUI7_9MYRT|nr:hypothetical protein MLD38_018652 [Melastoma candidum]
MKRQSPCDVGFDAYTFSSTLKACISVERSTATFQCQSSLRRYSGAARQLRIVLKTRIQLAPRNFPEEGIELFIQALECEQIEVDGVTFLLVLMATLQLQGLDLA